MPYKPKTAKQMLASLEIVNEPLRPKVKRQFTDDERSVIQAFLEERLIASRNAVEGIKDLCEGNLDDWEDNTVKYWRWTEANIRWLLSTLHRFGRGKRASNS